MSIPRALETARDTARYLSGELRVMRQVVAAIQTGPGYRQEYLDRQSENLALLQTAQSHLAQAVAALERAKP